MSEMRELFVNSLVELNETETLDLIKRRMDAGDPVMEILDDVRRATAIIGERFEEGRYFVSDLMMAGEILKQIMDIVRPELEGKKDERLGKVVIGTVKGDIHDIGKDIVAALLEAEGFEVIDIGVDAPPEKFISAIKSHNPDIVALSGLLTEAIESMRETVNAIRQSGSDVRIIIGGGRVDEEAYEYTGADEWADDAAIGVRKMKALMGVE